MAETPSGTETSIAVFIDFENLALAFPSRATVDLDVERILGRMLEKGKILVKKAYADWGRYSKHKKALHEHAIELIEIPHRTLSGKNSADIRLVVDAMDLSYSKEHINTFVIVSGDSDFSPLVSKLKENGKHVVGMGMKNSTSQLLMESCDDFIFYESLEPTAAPKTDPTTIPSTVPDDRAEMFRLMVRAVEALQRENKDLIYASMVKDTMKRMRPSFHETSVGYRSFSELLEEAEDEQLLELKIDPRSGTYLVSLVVRKKRSRRSRAKRSQ